MRSLNDCNQEHIQSQSLGEMVMWQDITLNCDIPVPIMVIKRELRVSPSSNTDAAARKKDLHMKIHLPIWKNFGPLGFHDRNLHEAYASYCFGYGPLYAHNNNTLSVVKTIFYSIFYKAGVLLAWDGSFSHFQELCFTSPSTTWIQSSLVDLTDTWKSVKKTTSFSLSPNLASLHFPGPGSSKGERKRLS